MSNPTHLDSKTPKQTYLTPNYERFKEWQGWFFDGQIFYKKKRK